MSDNHPVVSVCIPIYNVRKYIERCARSLFDQTYNEIEYIFVDDCCLDGSISILEQVIEDYPNRNNCIRILHHDYNRGLAAARNTSVAAATGDFIMHVDSDDWLENNAVELFVQRQEETGADIVSGNALAHYQDRCVDLIEPNYANKEEMLYSTIQMSLNHVLWRRLIRTPLYKDNGISAVEGVNIGEDHYTLPRLVYYAKSFAKLDAVVYHYNCMNDCSYMGQHAKGFNLKRYRDNLASIQILIDFFKCKETSYECELKEIYESYVDRSLKNTVRVGDYYAYKIVSNDMKFPTPSYLKNRMIVVICKIIRKMTGVRLKPLQ